MRIKIVSIVAILLVNTMLFAEEQDHSTHDHHQHIHPANEFGIANTAVYLNEEQELAYGLHLHYLHTIRKSKFGVGIGYEHIFDEHGHNTLGIAGSYRIIEPLVLVVTPGFTFGNHSDEHDHGSIGFATHVELVYEFNIHGVHIGPILEYAFEPEESHFSIGIHIGLGF